MAGPPARLRRPQGAAVTTFAGALDDQVQGYLDHLTIERGVAANTISSYRRDLRRIEYATGISCDGGRNSECAGH